MDGIQFADGFDAPDRLVLGLGAAQLLAVVGGALLAFLLLHAPLPLAVSGPASLLVAGLAAALGWLRVQGRPALDWALDAFRFVAAARAGVLELGLEPGTRCGRTGAPARVMSAAMTPRASKVIPLRPAAAHVQPPQAGGAHRVVFFSLKGGTGRTTLATEVAAALASPDASGARSRVALLDLDPRSAAVGARLGLAGAGVVDYALAPPDDRSVDDFLTTHASGLRVLLGPAQPQNPDWPVTAPVLREMLRELDMEGTDVVVLDVGAQLSGVTRAALHAADDVIVVVVPTASGIQDAYRTTEQLRALGLRRRLRYVVNRARGAVDVSVAMTDLGGELIAEIPDDATLTDAENAHCPATLSCAGPAARELVRLARRTRRELRVAALP